MRRSIAAITTGLLAGAVGLTCLSVPGRVAAQPLPPYARPAPAPGDETIRGVIVAMDGAYRITVRDDRGFDDTVELHPGTIINPRGLRLSVGMTVTIVGHGAGNVFAAFEIDTPYDADQGALYSTDSGYAGYDGYWPAFGLGLAGATTVIIAQPPGPPGGPPPPAPPHGQYRSFEHPTPGHPFRAQVPDATGTGTAYRAPTAAPPPAYHPPEYRSAPEYHAAPQPASRAPEVRTESRAPVQHESQQTTRGH